MKIGILGTRGIPNAYGGFEQFAQYLAEGLLEKGHEVWVYNSNKHPYQQKTWKGIHIIHCTDWENKIGTAGQFIYDFNCLIDAKKRNYDILFQLGYTSNSVWFRLWPKKSINVVNMDGLEWKRDKYNSLTKKFLLKAEKWAVRKADALVADSPGIQSYLLHKYKKQSFYIPYGAVIPNGYEPSILNNWQLKPHNYFLIIARMEPENNIEMIIKGYLASQQVLPMVILGNTSNKFGNYLLKNYSSPNLNFAGAIYDQQVVNTLRYFSLLYFHGHSVGGTNPSLLEAMACECQIAAHDNIFNKAILEDNAYYFSTPEAVTAIIDTRNDEEAVIRNKQLNLQKIRTLYSWKNITNQYEKVFFNLSKNSVIG